MFPVSSVFKNFYLDRFRFIRLRRSDSRMNGYNWVIDFLETNSPVFSGTYMPIRELLDSKYGNNLHEIVGEMFRNY